jgi:hypothetical protein
MTDYPYSPRVFDLDAVTEQLYEGGNLTEEVYRALGGAALPFFVMLDGERYVSLLAAGLREVAEGYLRELARVLTAHGIYASSDEKSAVEPRKLVIEAGFPRGNSMPAGRRSLFKEA